MGKILQENIDIAIDQYFERAQNLQTAVLLAWKDTNIENIRSIFAACVSLSSLYSDCLTPLLCINDTSNRVIFAMKPVHDAIKPFLSRANRVIRSDSRVEIDEMLDVVHEAECISTNLSLVRLGWLALKEK